MPANLTVTWTGDYGAVAVEARGKRHVVPGLLVYFRVAGTNYSGDRGTWCELALYETGSTWTIRAVNVDEHEGGQDRTITDFVSDDRGATWTICLGAIRGVLLPTSPLRRASWGSP